MLDRGTLYTIILPLAILVPVLVIPGYYSIKTGAIIPFLHLVSLVIGTSILIVITYVSMDAIIVDGKIYVKYLVRKSYICSVSDIETIYLINVEPKLLINQVCTGNRGFFGFAGCCRNVKGLGSICTYIRRSRNLVLLYLKRDYESWIKEKSL